MRPSGLVSRAVLLTLVWAGSLPAQQPVYDLGNSWTNPCTLDVVLVTFKDTTGVWPTYSRSCNNDRAQCDYDTHDLPHSYSRRASDGALMPGTTSYQLEDFERLFGTDGAMGFVDTDVTVADGTEELPEVFGSLRAYFAAVSSGRFELRVRIINRQDANGYPRWVQLPETKGFYGELTWPDSRYWDDARRTAQDSVRAWYPGTTAHDIPHNGYDRDRRLRHKVLFLYSGAEVANDRMLHPRADRITEVNPQMPPAVGYRYVAAERQGTGGTDHTVDAFTGIGLHVHEIGHLLGLNHSRYTFIGVNPYTGESLNTSLGGGLVGWGATQNGAQGPPYRYENTDNATYIYEYRSCTNPYNAIYRRDLGWTTPAPITRTTLDVPLTGGFDDVVFVDGADDSDFALELRTVGGFGQFTGWHRFAQAPGVLIWKRPAVGSVNRRPRLIPADGRSIFNAKTSAVGEEPNLDPITALDPTFVYPWQDRLSDPFGALEGNGLPSETVLPGRQYRLVVTEADDDSLLRRDPRGNMDNPSRRAFRNIRVNRDASPPNAEVDIYFDHWVGEIAGMETWGPDSVYVGGDVTILRDLTIADNTTVNFLAPTGTDVSDYPELIVSDGGTLTVGTGVTFGTVDRDGARTPTHGLRVETGGTATLNGVTISGGEHRWSGPVTVVGDFIVGDGTNPATLRLEAGTEVRFAATDAESDGQDEARVELIVENSGTLRAGAGEITFRSSSDAPSSSDWYGIRVAASGIADLSGATIRDGRRCVQLRGASTVTLTNTTLTNCGLTVALTGIPPVLGGRITASLDPGDGSTLNEEFWQWQGRASATDDWESLRPSTGRRYPAEGTYIPRDGVRGHMLRATLRYRARFGGGSIVYNYAQSAPTAAVAAGPPGPLSNCTASEGDRQVTIACDPAEANGSPLLRNEYRQSTDGGVSWDPNRWVEIPLGTNPNTMSVDVSNLRNGTEYTFELRAVNAVGAGASVRVPATPGSGPGVPPQPTSGLTASPGGGTGINVGWGAVEATPAVTGYRVRSQWALVGTSSWSSYDTVATPGARTLRYPHRDYENVVVTHRLRYQVQAVNAIGAGAWSAPFRKRVWCRRRRGSRGWSRWAWTRGR